MYLFCGYSHSHQIYTLAQNYTCSSSLDYHVNLGYLQDFLTITNIRSVNVCALIFSQLFANIVHGVFRLVTRQTLVKQQDGMVTYF